MLPSSMGWMVVLVFAVSTKILRRALNLKFKGRKDIQDNQNKMEGQKLQRKDCVGKKEQTEGISSGDR
jgi:hypothetical protein